MIVISHPTRSRRAGDGDGVMTECFLWLSVVENEDSPLQKKRIDGADVTHYTLVRLDHNSNYRFYLSGRTAAGDGEALQRDGATTLEGGKKQKKLYCVIF